MRKDRKNSYYRRLQLSFVILVFFPAIILSLITYFVNKDHLIEKVALSNEVVLNVIAEEIQQSIDDITFTSHMIVQDSNVIETLSYFSEKSSITSFEEYQAFKKLKEIYSVTEMRTLNQDISIFLINNNDFIIPSFRNLYTNESLRYHWDHILERINMDQGIHLQWIGEIPNEHSDNSTEFYFSRVIKEENNNAPIGVLNIAIPMKKIENLFMEVTSGEFALYDDKGHLIFGNAQMLNENKQEDEIRYEKVISQFNWKLVHSITENELTVELRKTLLNSLLILSFFVVLFLTISLIMARKLHHPIKKLQEVTAEFGAGNMNVEFKDTGYAEINALGQTINRMFNQINELILNIKKEQERKKELEIKALYSQIRPHFLINTLNSIRMNLNLEGNSYYSDKIKSLTMLLRKYMEGHEPSTIKNECELLIHYIDIMNMRNETEINFDVIISKELEDFELPFLLLQPIVENSILHGFGENDFGTIIIHAFKQSSNIVIQITDDGLGMSQDQCDKLNSRLKNTRKTFDENFAGKHVGLTNINQRLYLTYGEKADLIVESEYGFGTTIEITIHSKNNVGDRHV